MEAFLRTSLHLEKFKLKNVYEMETMWRRGEFQLWKILKTPEDPTQRDSAHVCLQLVSTCQLYRSSNAVNLFLGGGAVVRSERS